MSDRSLLIAGHQTKYELAGLDHNGMYIDWFD